MIAAVAVAGDSAIDAVAVALGIVKKWAPIAMLVPAPTIMLLSLL